VEIVEITKKEWMLLEEVLDDKISSIKFKSETLNKYKTIHKKVKRVVKSLKTPEPESDIESWY